MPLDGVYAPPSSSARASCLTYLAAKGVPDQWLARRAGHSDVRTTKRWYVKPNVTIYGRPRVRGENGRAPQPPLTKRM